MGFNYLKATEPLRGGSLRFTTKFPGIPGTYLIDTGRLKGWVNFGATQCFWKRDPDWESSALTTRPLLKQKIEILYWHKQISEILTSPNFADQSFSIKLGGVRMPIFLVLVGQFIRMTYFYISGIFRDKTWVTKDSKRKNYFELYKPLIESV